MCKKIGWKLAVIGGGGKIAGAVLRQLLERKNLGPGEVQLFGRTACNILDNIKLSDMVCTLGYRAFLINAAENVDSALEGADEVIYNATFGFEDFAEYKSLGIAHPVSSRENKGSMPR